MACNLKLLDYIKSENPTKVIPSGGYWSWGGGSEVKCGPFDTGQGTDPGAMVGDNPCIDVTGWAQMYYQFVYDTGKAFHYLVVNVKARPNAGCDTKIEICENDEGVNLKGLLTCSPDDGGTWYILNQDGINGTIDTVNGTYTPATGDGGSTLRMMYGFGGKQDGLCCGDSCQSAAILEIKVSECGCNDLHVILRRDKNDLIADYSGCGNTLTPEYRWYKDQDLIEGETGDTINFVGYGDGDFLVKVICGDCEEQDRFFSGETCAYPEIIGTIVDDEEEPYSVALDVRHILNTDIITILHRINVTEGGYDETEITTWDLTINDLTFDVTPGYGKNVIVVTLTNSCGTIEEEIEFYKTCPEEDPGLTALITTCEGCWGSLPAIDFLGGTPDAGGVWEDVLESGQLDGDAIHFDQLNVGLWEFRYTVNQDYASCTQSASLFVEVVAPLSSGNSSATDLCHDAGLTDLLSLVPGSPDPGGEWYTDDVIDGTIDLVNGTITPVITDIGKTITLAYSHTQETSELPDGVVLQECHYEFDGVNDFLQAVNLGDLEYQPYAMMDIELDISTPQYLMGNSSYLSTAGSRLASWYFRVHDGNIGITTFNNAGSASTSATTTPVPTSQRIKLEYQSDGVTLDLLIDDVVVASVAHTNIPTGSSPNLFQVGQAPDGTTSARFKGKVYSFQVGTETFQPTAADTATITGSEGTVLNVNGATLICEGVAPCDCNTFSLLTITIVDCTPPIPCPDDSGLGIDIAESANGSPSDPLFEDMLTFTKTGTYEDAGVVDTDDIYFSNDDGATWIKADEAKDSDYYVKLSSGFQTTCSGGAGTGSQRMTAVTLSTGEDVQEGQVRSRNGNFNINWTDIQSGDNLIVAGSSASLIAERYFRWDVRHVLNSGWVLHLTRTMFDRGGAGGACPNGIGGFGISFYSGNKAGKRKILIERRITYNNGCDPITIPEEFNPTLPDCPETPSGLGFTIVPPVPTGGGGWIVGSVTCNGTVPGATSDTVQVFFQAQGSPGYGNTSFACGGSYGLDLGENYVFHRIIQFADCPPIILMHNYNAPASCPTATLSCERDNANSRARATRTGTPFNLSSDYMQYRRGSGTWQAYTEGQWVSVTGTTTVTFRRVANYNNGCPQTTQTCSTTVTPPTYSLSISCSGGNTIVINAVNMPPGGVYHLYRSNVLVGSNSTGANFPVSINGDYEIRYRYNQYQYIYSNTVNCGTGGGGCTPPTVSIGACNIVNGNEMKIPFTTTNITSTSQINASVDPGSGSLVWNAATGQGTMTVVGTPGQSYDYEIIVTNQCGSDTAYRTCQVGCTSLQFDNVTCNHGTGQTTYDIITSPDTGDIPTSNGSYLSKPSSGVYRFRINQTTGTITGNHPLACTSISQSINCQCPEPVVNLSLTCNNTTLFYSFTVTNESSVTSDYYYLTVSGSNYVFANTGAGSYSGSIPKTGLAHSYDFYYNACGSTPHQTGNISCSCLHPSIQTSASCSGTTVSYSFTVTNESQATSNYTILVNGAAVGTVTRTGAGTYNGTRAVAAGSNNTVQVRVNSVCGGTRSSNIAAANCACAPASLSLSSVSCNAATQMLAFTVNQTNITGLQVKVNNVVISPQTNPYSVQGITGQNSIVVTGNDSCAGTTLQDSVTYGCDCDLPGITMSASCNTSGLVSFSLTVTDESRVSGNYRLIANSSNVKTITKTNSGTYNSTWQGSAGTNYTLRIQAENECGSTTNSNTVGTSCGCPASSMSITSASCNASNQMLSFNLNRTNVSNLVLKVNGVTISPIPSNPISVQGQIGNNMIVATAKDSCTDDPLSRTANVNCACTNNPTVNVGSASLAGTTLTVPITTTNISSAGQITFVANGITRAVTGSGNTWSASFPAVNGTNSYSASVSNSCGSDSDSGSYNYAPCVPPTITKIGQGTTLGGAFYVDFAVTNCDSISAPGTTNFVGCSTTRAQWNPGSSVLNWSITVNNGCGSYNISGSFDPCLNCNPTITSLGCESGSFAADYLFMLDNSGSIDPTEFVNFLNTIKATIDNIEASSVDARYAIVQFADATGTGPDAALTQNFTSNAATAKNITRWVQNGIAHLVRSFEYVHSLLGSTLSPRPGAEKHILVFTDDYARIHPFLYRDAIVNQGWKISVIKYPDPGDTAQTTSQYARNATVGGSYNGALYFNPGDPQGDAKPRRLYLQSGFTGNPIPGLTGDVTTSPCRLLAASGCGGGSSFSWAASGGGSILSGQGTNTITTNGIGSYTVTIDTGNGCEVQKTHNY